MRFQPFHIYPHNIGGDQGYLIMGKGARGIFVYKNEGIAVRTKAPYQYISYKEVYTYKLGQIGLRAVPLSIIEKKMQRKFNQVGIPPEMLPSFKRACDYVAMELKGMKPDLSKPVEQVVEEQSVKEDETQVLLKKVGRI